MTKGALGALVADAAPPDWRGSAYGIFNFASGMALLVATRKIAKSAATL